MEQEIENLHSGEIEAQTKNKLNTEKLLSEIADNQVTLDEHINNAQAKRDMERLNLFSLLDQVETESNNLIAELLAVSAAYKDSENARVLEQVERDQKMMDDMLAIKV